MIRFDASEAGIGGSFMSGLARFGFDFTDG